MIGKVATKDGQKIVEPISGSIPVGNPVGTLLTTYKKIQPRNYLYCDGSTFNASQYPALYLYLGSNVLPDYRECSMVGAEQNTTDQIATHDVYAQGEFKDDQIQNVTGQIYIDELATAYGSGSYAPKGAFANLGTKGNTTTRYNSATGNYKTYDFDASRVARAGTTTHGKQKAVYVYIKAVDGVDISDEDTFLVTVKNFVEEKNSYSTTEMLTGGKWIDGKPIYRKVLKTTAQLNGNTWGWGGLTSNTFADVDTLISCIGSIIENGTNSYSICCYARKTAGFYLQATSAPANSYFIVEYTKTTDS